MIDAETILAKLQEKQAAKIAALTPEQRADLERRQIERTRQLIQKRKKTDPQLSGIRTAIKALHDIEEMELDADSAAIEATIKKIIDETPPEIINTFLDNCRSALYTYLDAKDDDLADIAITEARRQGAESAANFSGILDALQASKAQGDRIEKTAVETRRDQLTRAHYDRANGIPTDKRNPGGGRKQVRDIGDKQVKAVLALSPEGHRRPIMECCAEIIRKGGKFKSPYADAKSLAAAVRRYCKRTKIKATFAPHKGKWSAKS